jgi:16S rRNA (guanine1207-N2)-methyltransferase
MSHYFSENQDCPLEITQISCVLRGVPLKFYVAGGVFSKSRVDVGSKILIENAVLEDGWKILDLGCGYGPVGISIGASSKNSEIFMTDINKRAVMLAKKSIMLNKLDKKRFKFFRGDSYSKLEEKKDFFDTILLNPPQTAGKKLCLSMIKNSINYLKKGGTLQLVARHNKGGESFMKYMKEIFSNAEFVCKSKGFRVYVSKKL